MTIQHLQDSSASRRQSFSADILSWHRPGTSQKSNRQIFKTRLPASVARLAASIPIRKHCPAKPETTGSACTSAARNAMLEATPSASYCRSQMGTRLSAAGVEYRFGRALLLETTSCVKQRGQQLTVYVGVCSAMHQQQRSGWDERIHVVATLPTDRFTGESGRQCSTTPQLQRCEVATKHILNNVVAL